MFMACGIVFYPLYPSCEFAALMLNLPSMLILKKMMALELFSSLCVSIMFLSTNILLMVILLLYLYSCQIFHVARLLVDDSYP